MRRIAFASLLVLMGGMGTVYAAGCDKTCLEQVAARYHAAWLAHDPSAAPVPAWCIFDNTAEGTATDDALTVQRLVAEGDPASVP